MIIKLKKSEKYIYKEIVELCTAIEEYVGVLQSE
jgi:hypothetical protein